MVVISIFFTFVKNYWACINYFIVYIHKNITRKNKAQLYSFANKSILLQSHDSFFLFLFFYFERKIFEKI